MTVLWENFQPGSLQFWGRGGAGFWSFHFCCVFNLDWLLHSCAFELAFSGFVLFQLWEENKENSSFHFLWCAFEGNKLNEGFEGRPDMIWKWGTLSGSYWVAEESYPPTSGWLSSSTWHKCDIVRWYLPTEKLVWLALYFRSMGAAKFCYPSHFIMDGNLSLTQALNKMWVTGWQRNDLIAVWWHAAMPHSVQDFFLFPFKLSKVTLSHFLYGRTLQSQMSRYCRNQCWCHWAPVPIQ